MLFSSFDFAIFFFVVFSIYFFTYQIRKVQNVLLLVSSYVFYGWWDWRFLLLIFASSVVDYLVGNALFKSTENKKRKILLIISLSFNLGVLAYFKYFNFFIDSFNTLLTSIGLNSNIHSLSIILPVGISFYTFQTMSYTIDIYKKKLAPTTSFINFMTFVSFFPQLVAGPIERASHLLPQFSVNRKFDYYEAKEGLKQIFWGLFKKVVVADNCALFVDHIFGQETALPGSTLFLGAVFFAFQIYGDFSGYSDMAIGLSRILGFQLMQNFSQPYLATNIQEFWRRWHISLSTWFKDYVYIPLGGNRVDGEYKKNRNIFITFTVSGLWHGANWTFIFWGMLHAFFHMVQVQLFKLNIPKNTNVMSVLGTGVTFLIVVFAWVFFRADSFFEATNHISNIFSVSFIHNPLKSLDQLGLNKTQCLSTCSMILFLMIMEFFSKDEPYNYQLKKLNKGFRYVMYFLLITLIVFFRTTGENLDFIYFQF